MWDNPSVKCHHLALFQDMEFQKLEEEVDELDFDDTFAINESSVGSLHVENSEVDEAQLSTDTEKILRVQPENC